MKFEIIEARAKRNKFDELAGDFYRDHNSRIVKELHGRNKGAYFGIQDNSGKYTIIGDKTVYFSVGDGQEREIENSILLTILQKNAMKVGKGGEFEFIHIDEKNSIWVLNSKVMCAMWNIVMLLCD